MVYKNNQNNDNKKGRGVLIAAIAFFACLACFAAYMAFKPYIESDKRQQDFDRLADNTQQQEEALTNRDGILLKYRDSYRLNSDMAGWIKIDNTKIDYPVMYTPDDANYYLRRDFNKEYSVYGVPYIGLDCTPTSDSVIIHGHSSRSGIMFGELPLYKEQSFFRDNQIINFDTLHTQRQYRIFAAARFSVDEEDYLPYYYGGEMTTAEYSQMVNWLVEKSLYDTGNVPENYEQILILSTCDDYEETPDRFIVAAYRIK